MKARALMSWNSDDASEGSSDADAKSPIEVQLDESFCDDWYSFMTKPEYTFGATLFFSFINLCVIITISLIFIESFPSFRRDPENVFFARMEIIFTIIFTFEYVTKLLIAPFCRWDVLLDFEEDKKKQYELWGTAVMDEDTEDEEQKAKHACRTLFAKLYYFFTDFPNLVDLMAILPVYIQMVIGSAVWGLYISSD